MGGDGGWTAKDRLLALAFTTYEDGLCSCGYAAHICRHPENDGYFDVDATVCYASAAIEIYRSSDGYKPDPGEQLGAVYTRTKDEPLPPLDRGKQPLSESDHGQDHAQ
jgi:hypothetical protein